MGEVNHSHEHRHRMPHPNAFGRSTFPAHTHEHHHSSVVTTEWHEREDHRMHHHTVDEMRDLRARAR